MAFFDEIGKKISHTSQGVVQKTKDTADIVRINSMISEQQKILNQYFYMLGKEHYVFSEKQNLSNPEELELYEKISKTINLINGYQEQIKILKGIEKCPSCNCDIVSGSQFCSHCGNKIQKNNKPRCSRCGNVLLDDALFCVNCGAKVEVADIDRKDISENNTRENETTIEYFNEKMQNRIPNEDEHQCSKCGSIQSKTIRRCLKCAELINDDTNNEINQRLCPNCQAPLDDDQYFCTNCGTKISNEYEAEIADEQFNRCPNCDAEIDAYSVFCTNCGFKLIDEEN